MLSRFNIFKRNAVAKNAEANIKTPETKKEEVSAEK